MNRKCSLIWEVMFYEFKNDHNTAREATKNICCERSKGTIDYSTVTRCFKKFCSGCKNLDNLTKSGRPKTVDSEAVLETIEPFPVRVSGELVISQFIVVHHLHNLNLLYELIYVFNMKFNQIKWNEQINFFLVFFGTYEFFSTFLDFFMCPTITDSVANFIFHLFCISIFAM